MDHTPDNDDRSNPISRAFSKFFERGRVGARTTAATPRAGTASATPRSTAPLGGVGGAGSTGATPAPVARPATTPSPAPASTAQAAAPTPTATQRTHTVAKGDTLSGIAQQVYGRASAWNLIYEANRNVLDDPDRIYPGQVLAIPDAPRTH